MLNWLYELLVNGLSLDVPAITETVLVGEETVTQLSQFGQMLGLMCCGIVVVMVATIGISLVGIFRRF